MCARARGSPPRAWGGRRAVRGHGRSPRLTPTCVGRTVVVAEGDRGVKAHPHVRGEDVGQRGRANGLPGSPPRAWGGPRRVPLLMPWPRLTPTCVGRTGDRGRPMRGHPAHPHVRGEDAVMPANPACGGGSPPRAWGGRTTTPPPPQLLRLTPTCVGRTIYRRARRRPRAAHPHVRGEDPPIPGRGGDVYWLTPTCVGRTSRHRSPPATRSAHPHVRGEDDQLAHQRHKSRGSPPRAWGGLSHALHRD